MNQINRIGLRVAGLTSLVLALLIGGYWGVKTSWHKVQIATASPTPTTTSSLFSNPDYADTLAKLGNLKSQEAAVLDTDGDGVPDITEINQGRDPSVAGISAQTIPLGEQVTDLSTHTNRYLRTLGTDTPFEQIFTKDRLTAFVSVNKGPVLPELPAGAVKTTPEAGKEAVGAYLDTTSPVHNTELAAVTNDDIQAAASAQFQGNDLPLIEISNKLRKNIELLKGATAPSEVAALHAKLIQATQSLLDNVTLLQSIPTDLVGGLIGAQKIEDLAPIFREISQEIDALDAKYQF